MALAVTSITPNFGPTAGNTPIVVEGTDFESANRVVLLCHCNGTDGSTTITDDSGFSNGLTAVGDAHIETDDKKFGTASVYLDGTGDYLKLENPYSVLGAFNGDFTVECWLKWKTAPSDQQVMGQHNWPESASSGTWWLFHATSTQFGLVSRSGGVFDGIYGNVTWETDVWYHLAASKKGTTLSVYINGSRIAVNTLFTRSIFADDSRIFTVGSEDGGSTFSCHAYIDDIRICKDFAAYAGASFDLPDAELKNQVARLTIDGNECTNVIVVSDTEITAKTPPGTVGSKDVVLNI